MSRNDSNELYKKEHHEIFTHNTIFSHPQVQTNYVCGKYLHNILTPPGTDELCVWEIFTQYPHTPRYRRTVCVGNIYTISSHPQVQTNYVCGKYLHNILTPPGTDELCVWEIFTQYSHTPRYRRTMSVGNIYTTSSHPQVQTNYVCRKYLHNILTPPGTDELCVWEIFTQYSHTPRYRRTMSVGNIYTTSSHPQVQTNYVCRKYLHNILTPPGTDELCVWEIFTQHPHTPRYRRNMCVGNIYTIFSHPQVQTNYVCGKYLHNILTPPGADELCVWEATRRNSPHR